MALRDTTWAYDTSDTGSELQVANGIITQSTKTSYKVYSFGGGIRSRTRSKFTREWINMTESGAQRVVDTLAADTNSKWTSSEANRIIGAYKLTQVVDSQSGWTLDT